jgi:hypothetical protein
MAKLKALGGAKWLRDALDGKETPCPIVATNTVTASKVGTVLSVWRHIVR